MRFCFDLEQDRSRETGVIVLETANSSQISLCKQSRSQIAQALITLADNMDVISSIEALYEPVYINRTKLWLLN